MRRIVILLIMLSLSGITLAQSDHPWLEQQDPYTQELLKMYGASEEYLNLHDKLYEQEQRIAESQRKERQSQTVILICSLLIASIPLGRAVKMAARGELKGESRRGIVRFVLMILLGSAVLFAVNFGWLTLHHRLGSALYFPMSLLIVVAIIVAAVRSNRS